MSKLDLNSYIVSNEEQEHIDIDEYELLEMLEHHPIILQADEGFALESIEMSQEGVGDFVGKLAKKLGKGVLDDVKDALDDLFSGSESIGKKYRGRLKDLIDRSKDLEGKEKRSIAPLVSVIYSNEKKQFITDIDRLIKDDINFIKYVMDVLKKIEDGFDSNLSTFSKLATAKDKEEFFEILEKEVDPKLITINDIISKKKYRGNTLKNARIVYKEGSDLETPIKLEYTSGDYSLKEKMRTNLKPYMTGRDVASILKLVDDIAVLAEELISYMKDLEEKFDPRTGIVHKTLIDVEKKAIDNVGIAAYVKGINKITYINISFLKSIDKVPRMLVSRNIKVLKTFVTFGEKVNSIKLNREGK